MGDTRYEGTTRHKFPSDHPDLLIRSQSILSSILLEDMYEVVLTFFLYLKLVNSKRSSNILVSWVTSASTAQAFSQDVFNRTVRTSQILHSIWFNCSTSLLRMND